MDKTTYKFGISIIIPVYNSEKYIRKCLDSVLAQTYDNYELLLVDDGSTDSSLAILQEYAAAYPSQIRVFHKENGGQSSARNLALNYINGEYVTFLDSDDYIDRRYLRILYSTAKKYNSDLVISGQKKVDETGKVHVTINYPVDKNSFCLMRRLNFAGKIYRTEFLKKHDMHFAEGKTYEDNPFNLKMMFLADNLRILSYSGYYQVGHYGSTTTKKIIDESLPYKELKECIQYLHRHRYAINDPAVYEYTVMSFFTYFIFQANKQHMFMDLEDRKSDIKVIRHLCRFTQTLFDRYFPQAWKNQYVRFRNNRELELKQRLGVWLFSRLIHYHMLEKFAVLYYELIRLR